MFKWAYFSKKTFLQWIILSLTTFLVYSMAHGQDQAGITEVVVVFKKNLPKEKAKLVLDKFKKPYREGMDSSRGKIYFYKTGPKFILKIKEDKATEFLNQCNKTPKIYECYVADWTIIKD